MSTKSKTFAHKKPSVYIKTYGCQMNKRDSEWVVGRLLEEGFREAPSVDKADVVIFNTCSVRKHAEDRAISNMGQLAGLKKLNPNLIFGIMGCTAEYYGKGLFERLPHLDFICGTGNIHKVVELIDKAAKVKKKEREKQLRTGRLLQPLPECNPSYRMDKSAAYVSISRGCNNFCAYCIVPYLRGPERSRMPGDILDEVRDLLDRGYLNITLLGQNVNSYGRDLDCGMDFVRLLKEIDGLKGKKAINFMTSHPKDASIELFEAMRDLKGLSRHLHLPLQSGSDRILKAMNRGYDSKYYLSKIKYFRNIVPRAILTTDIIVGFPGETREDFEATEGMLRKVEFDAGYIFKYSPRPPALSSKMGDSIPRDVKEKRHQQLLKLQRAISKRKRRLKD